MALSVDLISQFVKATKDETKKNSEARVYGTAKVQGTDMFVQLDGSDVLTPVTTTVTMKSGDRVIVSIKDHTATVTGNLTAKAINDGDIDGLGAEVARFHTLLAEKVDTDMLQAEAARIDDLIAEDVLIKDRLTATEADIKDIEAENVTVNEKLTATEAEIKSLRATSLTVDVGDLRYASIEDLDAVEAVIYNLDVTYASAERLEAAEAEIDTLTANMLTAENADLKYANIDFTNIGKATMQYFYAQSGLIKDVVVGDQTITGELVGVTISGDRLIGNTVIAEKLVIKGSDGLYYKLNTDGMTVEAEQTDENSLNGQIIKAKSITATKISVDDLVAFDATIGGFNIGTSSLYSGVKSSVDNTTRGIYLDTDGQVAFGDASNFLKYYKDADGNYKLEISAKSVLIGDNGTSLETALEEIQNGVDNIKIGGRNLLLNSAFSNGTTSWVIGMNTTASVEDDSLYGKCIVFTQSAAGDGSRNRIFQTPFATGLNHVVGETYTLSFYAKASTTSAVIKAGHVNALTSFTIANTWKKYTCTYTSTSTGSLTINAAEANITIYIALPKLEHGNKSTDWSPAPEDLQNGIDGASKTATNYLRYDAEGLIVGDMTVDTLSKNVRIDMDSVDIRNGETVLASFGADTVILGQNAENSSVSLCDGAGIITARASEASASVPKYDGMNLESQDIGIYSRRSRMDTLFSGSAYANTANMDLLPKWDAGEADAVLEAGVLTNGTNDETKTGMSVHASYASESTYTKIYAESWDNTSLIRTSNSMSIYPTVTQFTKPISINGTVITGANKVLWSGGYHMIEGHTCTLSETVSAQPNGIVLVFCEYHSDTIQNSAFHTVFIPKQVVAAHDGVGHTIQLSTYNAAHFATKYVYVFNTGVTGHVSNTNVGTAASGITYTNNRFILRYIIGV